MADSTTSWTVACQAPLPWNFLGKNTGVGCHFSPGTPPQAAGILLVPECHLRQQIRNLCSILDPLFFPSFHMETIPPLLFFFSNFSFYFIPLLYPIKYQVFSDCYSKSSISYKPRKLIAHTLLMGLVIQRSLKYEVPGNL